MTIGFMYASRGGRIAHGRCQERPRPGGRFHIPNVVETVKHIVPIFIDPVAGSVNDGIGFLAQHADGLTHFLDGGIQGQYALEGQQRGGEISGTQTDLA